MKPHSATARKISIPTPFLVGDVLAYLLTGEQNILIDTGPDTDESWEALNAGLRDAGLKAGDVHHVLITHGHEDHYGLAGRLADAGARIYLPETEFPERNTANSLSFYQRELQQGGMADARLDETLQGLGRLGRYGRMPADYRSIVAGSRMQFGDIRVQAVSAAGHTPGHAAYFLESSGLLFAGDCAIPAVSPIPMLSPDPAARNVRFSGLTAYRATFERLARLQPKETCSGHRGSINQLESYFEKATAFYASRQKRILALLAHKESSPYEVAIGLYPAAVRLNYFLALSESVAHLDELQERGQVGFEMRQGVRFYGIAI